MDLVRADYYEEEVHYQGQLDRLNRTTAVRDQIRVEYDAPTSEVRVQLPSDGVAAGAGIEFYVTLLLASIASVALGLALSAASMSEERAITLVPLALIPQIMFAGIIFKLNTLTCCYLR